MTNDRPPVPQPPADMPLGIQRPLLPSVPLGQSLLQPKFLTPLGARSLSVLDPAIFLSGQNADLPAWESPFQDSPFFDLPPARSPNPTPAVQTKPRPTASNPVIDPVAAAPDFESVTEPPIAELTSAELPTIDPETAAPDFEPITEPPITEPFPTQPTPAELISAQLSASELSEPPPASPNSLIAPPVTSAAEPPAPAPTAPVVQRSPENLLGSEAIAPLPNLQLDPPDLGPEAQQPTLTEAAAAIDFPATVQRSLENSSPENSPIPASETAAIAPTLAAEPPVSQAAPTEIFTFPNPAEPERSPAPESVAPPVLPPPPATIQRVEIPEAAAEIEPILAAESIDPGPGSDADVAPAIQTKLEPTVSPSDLPIAQPISDSPEPTIGRLAEKPSSPAPLLRERGAEVEAVASELEQSSGEEILSNSATPEAVQPPSLSIEPALIEPSPSSSPPSKSESNFSTNSETESTPNQTVQRSIVESETLDFEAENSVDAIAPSVSDDRTDAPKTVQRKTEVPTPTETRAKEFNQALFEPNFAIDAPESRAEPVAQASSLPGRDAAPTSKSEPPKAQESRSTENISAQNQLIDPSGDSLETPTESLSQVASIEPVQNPAIVSPQIQALAEITPSSPQSIQPESSSNSSSPVPSEIGGEAPVNPSVETENIPLQLIQPEGQAQSVPSIEMNRTEDISQAESSADSAVQLKVQEQLIAPNSIIPIEKTEAISQLLVPLQIKTEDFSTKQTDFLAASEIGSTDSPERDRTEETQLSPTQPIAENLSSPTQRKAAEANSSKPSSINLPKAEPKVAIDQILLESTDNLELETQSSNNVSPEPTFAVEPSVKRSTSEIRQTEEISTPLPRRESESFPETEPATLPELPTVIQRLSVLEPIAQMKPLYSSTDSSTVQPLQAARSTTIPDMQTQQFDRLFDLPPPPNVMRKSDVAPLDSASTTSPVTAEWSNIAELFQASEAFRSEPSAELSTDSSFEFNGELETMNELNGYSDLNLSLNNVGPSDVGSDVAQAKRQPPTEVSNSDAIETHPKSHSAQVSASPEQLERLAQEIYQLVRQRLALERERFGNAGSGRLF